jgi:hypothetical protein
MSIGKRKDKTREMDRAEVQKLVKGQRVYRWILPGGNKPSVKLYGTFLHEYTSGLQCAWDDGQTYSIVAGQVFSTDEIIEVKE